MFFIIFFCLLTYFTKKNKLGIWRPRIDSLEGMGSSFQQHVHTDTEVNSASYPMDTSGLFRRLKLATQIYFWYKIVLERHVVNESLKVYVV
jgi:hypothetical protein